jgi:hypothetical protein
MNVAVFQWTKPAAPRKCIYCVKCDEYWASFSVTKSLFNEYFSLKICWAVWKVPSYSLHYVIKCLRQNSVVLKNFSGMFPQVIIEMLKYPKWYRLLNMHSCFASPHRLNQMLRQWTVFSDRKRLCALSDADVLLASRYHAGHKNPMACKHVQVSSYHTDITFGIPHARRMRRIVLCHKWRFWLYRIFPRYLINDTILGILLKIKCVFFILSTTLPKTFHFVRRVWRDVIINVHMSSCKVAMAMIRC